MPIPKPGESETEPEFMDRCMGDEYMQEFPGEQRAGVCSTAWREKSASKFLAKSVEVFCADGEKRLLYGVVYAPDEVDSHGDQADADTIEVAAHGFMAAPLVGIQHEKAAPARVVESYIAPQDLVIGKRVVTKGSWVVAIKVDDDELWGQVKAGSFGGLSLGGYAEREVDDAPAQ